MSTALDNIANDDTGGTGNGTTNDATTQPTTSNIPPSTAGTETPSTALPNAAGTGTPPTGDANGTVGNTDNTDANTNANTNASNNNSANAGDDWASIRTRVAGGDDKILNRLSRYSTLDDALKAGIEAQNKIGSMKKQPTISADSTPEEIAEYRQANGIPEKPDGYTIELGDGLVLGDQDKPVVDAFLQVAHEHNLPPRTVNAIVAQQLQLRNQLIQEQEDQDIKDRTATSAALTSNDMWGREAKRNANIIANMLDQAPPGIRDGLLSARLPNGKLLGNDVEAMQWLANQALAIDPYATVVPANGLDAMATVDAEMAAIEAKMGTPEYIKNEAMQERYRQLINIKQKATNKTR